MKREYERWLGKDSLTAALINKNLQWLKRFYYRGGLLVAGTDPTNDGRTLAGYANQRTLEILVEAGFTLPQAINICTLNGAVYLERKQEIGSLEVGKKADVVLLDGSLQKEIKNIRKMEIALVN